MNLAAGDSSSPISTGIRLYILDKQTKVFTKYLYFNGLEGRPGLFRRFTFQRNFATGLINVVLDPDYARNGVFYTIHMEDPTLAEPADPKTASYPSRFPRVTGRRRPMGRRHGLAP